jgi:hypothetical protein
MDFDDPVAENVNELEQERVVKVAAFEQPELFVEDVRTFFATVR